MIASMWRFTPHVRAESRGVAALLALALLGVLLDALLPWPLKLIVDYVLTGEPLPHSVLSIESLPGGDSPEGMLAWLALGLLLTFFAAQALKVFQAVLQTRVGAKLQYSLAGEVLAKLHDSSLVSHYRAHKGDRVRRVTTDTTCLPNIVTGAVLPVLTSIVSLLVLFTIMWKLEPVMAVVAALVAVPMTILMRLLGPRMSDRAYEHQEIEGQVWSVAEQTLTALPLVQAFGREAHEQSRFSGMAKRSIRAALRSLFTQIQFKVGIDGSLAVGTAVIMLVGGVQVLQGRLTVGSLIVFLSYLTALYAPLLTFAYLTSTLASAAGSARRVAEVLDEPTVVPEKHDAKPLKRLLHAGHVRLEGVVFGYEPATPVLHGIDFEARPGETVALVGPSGAGKSTLIALIPRLFDPWDGRVLIGDQDLRDVTLSSVRDSVSLVLQDPFLLPMSIAENIAYGRPGANRAAIEAAARAASAHDFIDQLPDKYETVVGERGITLSAGQRQRLAIARAVLKDAPILVLDEPTSALDVLAEAAVMEAMRRLAASRTTIVIAHRLSTVRRADRIVVLDGGRAVEAGSHDTLLARSRIYRSFYLAQILNAEMGSSGTVIEDRFAARA